MDLLFNESVWMLLIPTLQNNPRINKKNDPAIFPRTLRRDKNNILLYDPLISRLSLSPDIALPRTPRALSAET